MDARLERELQIMADNFSCQVFDMLNCCGGDLSPSEAIQHVATIMMNQAENWNPENNQ